MDSIIQDSHSDLIKYLGDISMLCGSIVSEQP